MTPTLYSHPSSTVDLEAIIRRVFARDRGEPLDGPYSLRPDHFDTDRDLCREARDRLAGHLGARSTFHLVEATDGPGDGSSAILSVTLDSLAEEVANTAYDHPSIIKLTEAERATHPLAATPDITALLDTCGSAQESIEDLVVMFISALQRTPITPKYPTEMGGYSNTDEGETDA